MNSFGKTFFSAVAVILLAASSQVRAADMSKSDSSPQDVLSKIHTVNQHEIELGHAALKKAEATDVKDFARQMIQDHSAADKQVMALAKKENLALTVYPMEAPQKAKVDQLMASTGKEFDRLYTEMMRKGHEKALTMLHDAEKQVSDPQVKALVAKLIPKIQHHEHLAYQLKPEKATSAS